MDFDFDRFVEVENVINAIFNGFPVHFDPDGPQMPTVPGLQQRSSTPSTSTSDSSSMSSTSTFASTSASIITPSSVSTSAPSFVKRVGTVGTEPPSWSSPAAYLADRRAYSAKMEAKPNVDLDTIEKLLFPADLDGSSAIALSKRLGADGKRSHELAFGSDDTFLHRPRKFMTVDDACRIPHKAVRDELVKLYFQYFHPFCPVVDEYDFMQVYDKIEDDEQLGKSIELPLFQAMMFVAFGHISPVRLLSTPFKTVYEGQRAYFDKASLLYRINFSSDQLILTKVALLLSFWSPFDSEYQVNSYWVDRAFIHARAMKLWEPQNETTSSRRQIVWWCCLLRDRMISFALRRSYRIQEAKSTWPLVSMSDFGLEVMFPRFMDAKTKRTTLEAFICLCDLSDVIRDIAVFQENNSFDREWSGGHIDKAAIVPEITQVSQFDNRLKNWKETYLKLAGDYIKALVPRSCRMPNYVLIVGDSVLATLYLPYIHCPSGSLPIVQRFQKFSLGRLKAASSMVALHVRNLNTSTKIEEEIIVGIIAWIGLPMAVFKVLSELDSKNPDEAAAGRFSDFVPLLSSLATRFHAAEVLSDMMGEATNEIVERSFKLGIARKETQHRVPDRHNVKPAEVVDRSKEVDEAEILNCVAKMVDLRFSTDGLK